MVSYIIRRLIAAVGLVIVISMITFAIFYLLPRLAGASPETLATRYVGRAATQGTVQQTAERLGFYDPLPVQYWHWVKGVVGGTTVDLGSSKEYCPAPCLGYSVVNTATVNSEIRVTFPISMSLALQIGCARAQAPSAVPDPAHPLMTPRDLQALRWYLRYSLSYRDVERIVGRTRARRRRRSRRSAALDRSSTPATAESAQLIGLSRR